MKILKECRATGDMQPFIEAFQKNQEERKIKKMSKPSVFTACVHGVAPKPSSIPQSLRKKWETEDAEVLMQK